MSIYIGIDWSQDKHDVAFMNASGAIIARLTIPHQPAGFHKLETTRSSWLSPRPSAWWGWKQLSTCF